MDKLTVIKALLGIKTDEWDVVIKFHISSVIQKILNYCNIKKLPEALEPLVIEIVQKHMRITNEEFMIATATKFGDTSVNFNTDPIQDNILDNVKSQLNRFRRLDIS